MKKITLAPLIVLLVVLFGCESMGPKAEKGAVVGGLVGAVAGGVIGNQVGGPFIGAGIGAATGAVAGGLIGDAWDKQDQAALAVNTNHLALTKIAEMGDQGTADAVIISEIQRTHSVYQLNSEIITYLKQHKVSDKVIDYMMFTAVPAKKD